MIKLVRDLEPSSESPVIIVLDEANILIRKITDGILPHKNIPTLVHDKITFNRYMDDMMFYEHVILILTSNESKKSMDDIDESYLRKGRINEYFTL
jgi:Cdc6-like AAA superfamily ATPase